MYLFLTKEGHIKKISKALPAVLTAGVCDTLLICLAVDSVSIMVLGFEWLRNILFLAGFLFLTYMGWMMWQNTTDVNGGPQLNRLSIKRQVAFAASVSLLNPHAILDTIGIIGTNSLVYTGLEKWMFTAACIGISWIWFFALALTGRRVGQLDKSGRLLKRMNQTSAFIVWSMAVYMGYQLFF